MQGSLFKAAMVGIKGHHCIGFQGVFIPSENQKRLIRRCEAQGADNSGTVYSPVIRHLEGWTQSHSQQERRASSLCCSTSNGRSIERTLDSHSAEADEDADAYPEVSAEEIDRRLRKAAALIATADSLAPFDRRTFNAALLIWTAIRDIPPTERPRLLSMVMPQDIVKLWRVAGDRYMAGRYQLAEAQGPEYSLYDDFPEDLDQILTYEGRAAVPLNSITGGFRKIFFLQPRTFEMYGRVQVRKGPLGELLYPLYYKCSIGTTSIPATDELSDVQLEYLDPEELGLQPADVPSSGRWPHIRPHRWPFNGGLVDYLRAVGPGVYVGVGWKRVDTAQAKRFLYFLLVRRPDN